ncbi:glycine zipper domain-containing protein [Mucilaginibacter sp. PAMB04168]|uniref:YMGG-like glycine zipper-containing protein n=1 Tax=Mucilaginibacter sp. PAMB04168 TaxID=3138567 RepID=UPI0031F65F55
MKKTILLFGLIFTFIISAANVSFAQQKKGMSSQAKGALIGGAGGAVAGTLIGHNVKGALIGGAIGAGGGYIIGNEHRRNEEKRKRAYYRAHHTKKQYYKKYGTYK